MAKSGLAKCGHGLRVFGLGVLGVGFSVWGWDESGLGRKCHWTKLFLDESVVDELSSVLDESVFGRKFVGCHFAQGLHCFCVVGQAHCDIFSFLLHRETLHATQGMEHRSGAGWLDTIDPRSTSTFCEVADEGTKSEEAERSGSRIGEVSPDISGNP